ncbi:hypothetical protein DFP73DRAFT_530834 [Morchella snyderi]|nr:hypothetical protein DFP73DRAFT_530834 [Morchella snyderi]
MRYQQQRVQMSPNWREKEAMSTQKLMAATTNLHLKQDEEITRLRRNVSSLAKKNHGLMRQVHELVSRLRQYPPPRIPDGTMPTNQDKESQKETSPENKEDTQMEDIVEPETDKDYDSYYSLFQPRPGKPEPMPQPSKEYDILPDCVAEEGRAEQGRDSKPDRARWLTEESRPRTGAGTASWSDSRAEGVGTGTGDRAWLTRRRAMVGPWDEESTGDRSGSRERRSQHARRGREQRLGLALGKAEPGRETGTRMRTWSGSRKSGARTRDKRRGF